MQKTLIGKIGKYDVTHETNPFDDSEMCYFVSIVLGDSYRHTISVHTLESDALNMAQQLQERNKANEYATR